MERSAIPINVKRRVLLEAGYRCSIPACRFPVTEVAHIVPWAETQDHTYENLIALCPNCHTSYHERKIPREALIAYKKKLMFLNDVYSRFEIDLLDYLKTHERAVVPGELFIKRLLDENKVEKVDTLMSQEFEDGQDFLVMFEVRLTDSGKRLLEDWGKIDHSLTLEED